MTDIKLTPQQEHFAQCVAGGMNQSDAYRAAFDIKPTTLAKTVNEAASRLMAKPHVKNYMDGLRRLRLRRIAEHASNDLIEECVNLSKKKYKGEVRVSKINRYAVFHRANFKCQSCGAKPTGDNEVTLHIDHVIPKSLGGSDDMSNLQSLCCECNLSKSNGFAYDHNKDIDLWN